MAPKKGRGPPTRGVANTKGGWLVKKWVWYVLGVFCGHFGGRGRPKRGGACWG
jgi:hypothetical protein